MAKKYWSIYGEENVGWTLTGFLKKKDFLYLKMREKKKFTILSLKKDLISGSFILLYVPKDGAT